MHHPTAELSGNDREINTLEPSTPTFKRSSKHAEVFRQFPSGSFVVHKTKRPFSSIALDHTPEQEKAAIKGDGGAVGLTENPAAWRRRMISGSETAIQG